MGVKVGGQKSNQDLVMVQVHANEASFWLTGERITHTQEVELLRQERARTEGKRLMPLCSLGSTVMRRGCKWTASS